MSVRTDLPGPVLALITSSFDDRINKIPNSEVKRITRPVQVGLGSMLKNWVVRKIGSELRLNDYSGGNLDNAFERAPTSLDDALNRCLTLRDLSNLTKLYDRCRILTSGTNVSRDAIWEGLRWVRRGWSTSSYGFDVALKDRVLQRQLYDQLILERKLALDGPRTAAAHPGCSCWRELRAAGSANSARGREVLHLLIGDDSIPGVPPADQERLDQIHVDFETPCEGASVDVCDTSLLDAGLHATQVFLNMGVPDNPFSFPDLDLEVRKFEKAGAVPPASMKKAATLRAEFAAQSVTWACQGYAGHDEAQRRYDELKEIRDSVLEELRRPIILVN